MKTATTRNARRWNFGDAFTRLREGDLVLYDGKAQRIVRVTPTAAYVAGPAKTRTFTTVMGQTVTLKTTPPAVAISNNAEIPILEHARKEVA
jgi:ABC-type Fe3+-hydroxamate transport system substrate-binding protein